MNADIIRRYLPAYRKRLSDGNEEEKYKWDALRNFQTNWDIEAPDFKAMFSRSLQAESSNLWQSLNYLPKKMIESYCDIDPEAVREAFRSLYDEEQPVGERIEGFIAFCQDMLHRRNEGQPAENRLNQHYHRDVRAISLYLFFRYPERHYLYKFSFAKQFLQRVGADTISARWSAAEKYRFYCNVCDGLREILEADDDLMGEYRAWLSAHGFNDPANHLLTQDVLMCIGEYGETTDVTAPNGLAASRIQSRETDLPSKNVILYGPPGTGKTYRLRSEFFDRFTERRQLRTEEERLDALAAQRMWNRPGRTCSTSSSRAC